MKIDQEFKNLIPPLTAEEFAQLEQNCLDYGIRDSLVITALPGESDTVLIDGHNRFEIAQKHNLAYNVRRLDFKDRDAIKEWIIKNQLGRRNIPAYVRAELALKLKPEIEKKAKERMLNPMQNSSQGTTRDQVAKAAGVSHDTIHKVEVIQKEASEDVKKALRSGEMSINSVYGSIVASKVEDKRKAGAREVREAERRAKEFEEERQGGIVGLEAAKLNKRDRERIQKDCEERLFKDLYELNKWNAPGAICVGGKTYNLLEYSNKAQLREISSRLAYSLRIILHLQKLVEEEME